MDPKDTHKTASPSNKYGDVPPFTRGRHARMLATVPVPERAAALRASVSPRLPLLGANPATGESRRGARRQWPRPQGRHVLDVLEARAGVEDHDTVVGCKMARGLQLARRSDARAAFRTHEQAFGRRRLAHAVHDLRFRDR